MKVNVQAGGRAKAPIQSDRTAVSLVGLEPGLTEQVARDCAVHHLQHGRHQLGCAASSRRSGMGGESTHWRTGTWGMTWPTQ